MNLASRKEGTEFAVWVSAEELVALRGIVTLTRGREGFPAGAVLPLSRWESARGRMPVWATPDELRRLRTLIELPGPWETREEIRAMREALEVVTVRGNRKKPKRKLGRKSTRMVGLKKGGNPAE